MRYTQINSELFITNREELKKALKANSICVLHSNDVMPTNADGFLPFRQNNDLLYLSGIDQEETVLILFPDAVNERDREILFVRETNDHIAIWEGEKLSKAQATDISGVRNVQWVDSFDSTFQRLVMQAENVYLTTNEHHRSESPVETRNDRFVKKCRSQFPLHKYERLAPILALLRSEKHEIEVELIKEACAITKAGFLRTLSFVQAGVGEWEIEAELIHEFIKKKSKGFAYAPIIASGKSSCILHYTENNKICKDGDVILMDVAAEYANWNSDLTRVVPVNGKFTDRQRAIYNSVLSVFRGACEMITPGLNAAEYQSNCLELMEAELLNLGLLSVAEIKEQGEDKSAVKKYFMHSTSHHLGLDVHDVNISGSAFSEGNVLTVEPGIYIPEEGIGVRLENDIWLSPNGTVDLMSDIPIEAGEIEELMHS